MGSSELDVVLVEACRVADTIQSTDLWRQPREMLDRAGPEQEPVIVHTYHTPQAVIIPHDQDAVYQDWQKHRWQRGRGGPNRGPSLSQQAPACRCPTRKQPS
jgi:hypothetical protein